MRAIIHVDMDAFYAAVEQRDRPELRGRPVVVAGLGRRGVVATASYEARVFGVHSAMATARARRLCPHAEFVEPRMARYAEVSAEVFAAFAEATPEIEGLSLDEAFLDVTRSLSLLGDVEAIAHRIKVEVLRRTGLSCSVGMAHNKLLAKLASEMGKPDGFVHLLPDAVRVALGPLPVSKLWTVGKVAAQKLERNGIRTIGALRTTPLSLLRRLFGEHGETLARLANGEDERPVVADREDKSIGGEHTFAFDLTTLADARAWLMRLCERVCERARTQQLEARCVSLKLRVPPFETMTRQTTLPAPAAATAEVFAAASSLLEQWWREREAPSLRLLGVTLSRFGATATPPQPDLFAPPEAKGNDRMLDSINERFGRGAIRHGRAVAAKEGKDDA